MYAYSVVPCDFKVLRTSVLVSNRCGLCFAHTCAEVCVCWVYVCVRAFLSECLSAFICLVVCVCTRLPETVRTHQCAFVCAKVYLRVSMSKRNLSLSRRDVHLGMTLSPHLP